MIRKLLIKSITITDFNERAQINLMDFQLIPYGKFNGYLFTEDYVTKYVIFRPLESKKAPEFAMSYCLYC